MTINSPPTDSKLPVADGDKEVGMASWPQPWRNWMTAAWRILIAAQQSGPTAERPTELLWPGRPYMDLTLNKPIWYTTAGWRDATGALV